MSLLTIVLHFFLCTQLHEDGRGPVACKKCKEQKAVLKSAHAERLRKEEEAKQLRDASIKRFRDDSELFYGNYNEEYVHKDRELTLGKYISDAYYYFRNPERRQAELEKFNAKAEESYYSNMGLLDESDNNTFLENYIIRLCHNYGSGKYFSNELLLAFKSYYNYNDHDLYGKHPENLRVFLYRNHRPLLDKLLENWRDPNSNKQYLYNGKNCLYNTSKC